MTSASGRYRPLVPFEPRVRQDLTVASIETAPAFAFSNEQALSIDRFTVVGYYRDYDSAPDDERFVMVFPVDERDGCEPDRFEIIIVLNWTEELKRRVPAE
jgi:hypothetical protein